MTYGRRYSVAVKSSGVAYVAYDGRTRPTQAFSPHIQMTCCQTRLWRRTHACSWRLHRRLNDDVAAYSATLAILSLFPYRGVWYILSVKCRRRINALSVNRRRGGGGLSVCFLLVCDKSWVPRSTARILRWWDVDRGMEQIVQTSLPYV